MADLSDVESALCTLIEAAVYPNGLSAPSVSNTAVKIYRGWPKNRALNSDLASGFQTVTVFSKKHSTRDTTRYAKVWKTVGMTSPTLTVSVSGDGATFGGVGGVTQAVGLIVDGVAYAYSVLATDTPLTVATAISNLVPGAILLGLTVQVPNAVIEARIVGSGTARMETRRQEQGVMVALWCSTPLARDLLAATIDTYLSNIDWFDLPDGTAARLQYRQTFETDASETASLYRRDLDYLIEYPTTLTMTGPQMLFGVGLLSGPGPEAAFGCQPPLPKLVVPPLGAIRFDAWYDPSNPVDQQCAAALSPASYNYRLPPQAVVDAGVATWPLATQATLDAEIAAALQAGLSFWAFDSYQPTNTLSLALQLYLSSSLRGRLRFCMLGQTSNWGSGGEDQPSLLRDISMMTQSGYMTVLGGRPLYLVLDASALQTSGLPAGGVASAISFVRAQVQAAGGGNPYIVFLSGAAFADYPNVSAAEAVGADATGAYAVPRLDGSEQGYSALAQAARDDWSARAASGFPFVPTAMCGWDQRPLIETPQSFYPITPGATINSFYDQPEATALGDHVVDMVGCIVQKQAAVPAQVGLVYAWNELTEGGWLMPTYTVDGPDATRVAAVGAALAAAVVQSVVPQLQLVK